MLLGQIENYEYCLWKYKTMMQMLGEKLEGGRRIDPDNGLIMPWYTSPCLEWLITLDLKGKYVFEYGVGDSTYWFYNKGCKMYGVDSDHNYAVSRLAYHESKRLPYLRTIYRTGLNMYDIVVIDGDFRDQCTMHALTCLKPDGYLIIDNYKQKSADLEHWPLTEKLIEGMPITIYKEPDHEDWQTAVITKV